MKYKIGDKVRISGLAEEPRNLIPLIAKELGVEIGERFKVNKVSGTFYFENYYLLEEGLNNFIFDNEHIRLNFILSKLINGHWKIEKLPQKPILTEDEKAILRNLPKQYKWIARDKDCSLNIYDEKPDEKYAFHWNFVSDIVELCPFEHLFQFIKWEDSEPYKIQELLEEYEKGEEMKDNQKLNEMKGE